MIIENLSKSFGNKKPLDNFSLKAKTGITVIIGESGKGKTTLLRIIAGLEEKDSGIISNTGKISYSFQEPRLFEKYSVLENASVCEREKGLAKKILSDLNLQKDLYTPTEKLSGGMKMRVSIARALAAEYDTLLLDEPFAGLDEENTIKAFNTVKKYSKGKTVLLVTHNEKIIPLSDFCVNL